MSTETPNQALSARILVMDDEKHILNITRKMLERFGHCVDITLDGEDAVHRYKAALENGHPFHLVIMDLTIPGGMGGREASEAILAMDPHARILISSGYGNDPLMTDFAAFGLKGIIPKPFRVPELQEIVDRQVRKSAHPFTG